MGKQILTFKGCFRSEELKKKQGGENYPDISIEATYKPVKFQKMQNFRAAKVPLWVTNNFRIWYEVGSPVCGVV